MIVRDARCGRHLPLGGCSKRSTRAHPHAQQLRRLDGAVAASSPWPGWMLQVPCTRRYFAANLLFATENVRRPRPAKCLRDSGQGRPVVVHDIRNGGTQWGQGSRGRILKTRPSVPRRVGIKRSSTSSRRGASLRTSYRTNPSAVPVPPERQNQQTRKESGQGRLRRGKTGKRNRPREVTVGP
jgi:hypothetical protein